MFVPAATELMIRFNDTNAPTLPLVGWLDAELSMVGGTRPAVFYLGRLRDATDMFGGIREIHLRP